MPDNAPEFQKLSFNGHELAYDLTGPQSGAPGIIFLPGYFSDMTGAKATFLAEKCAAVERRLTRFDYSGHGASSGKFVDGCIGDWLADAVEVLDALTSGPQIIVGSSMGGWIMLLLALARPERVAGLVGIAAAPDFTEDLVWNQFSAAQQNELMKNGKIYEPSEYGEPLVFTKRLIEEGRRHLLLRGPINIRAPVRLLQGQRDDDVPWKTAHNIAEKLTSKDVRINLIKDGDHRLSRGQDMDLLWREIESLS